MKSSYWKSNLIIVTSLLFVWFIVSYGFGIIWSDELDNLKIGGFKLGFWFSQQGSIYFFVIIIFTYVYLLNKLDKKYFNSSEKSEIKENRYKNTQDFYQYYLLWGIIFYVIFILLKSTFLNNIIKD